MRLRCEGKQIIYANNVESLREFPSAASICNKVRICGIDAGRVMLTGVEASSGWSICSWDWHWGVRLILRALGNEHCHLGRRETDHRPGHVSPRLLWFSRRFRNSCSIRAHRRRRTPDVTTPPRRHAAATFRT